MPSKKRLATAVGLALAALAQPALADSHYWNCNSQSSSWTDNCWTGGQPGAGDDVYLTSADANKRTVQYASSVTPAPSINVLRVDATGSGSFTLNLNAASQMTASYEAIGVNGAGAFNQSGGTNNVSVLEVGWYAGSKGTFNLSGGTLTSSYNEDIGLMGNGTFNQSGGTNRVIGTNTLTGRMSLGVSSGAVGTYNQTGGSASIAMLDMGYNAGGTGTYNLSGGSLVIGKINTPGGTGTLNLDGGTLAFDGSNDNAIKVTTLNIAGATGSAFTLGVKDGTQVTAGAMAMGQGGIGNVKQSGGSVTAGTLDINRGTYRLAGGTLTVTGALNNADTIELAGGIVTASGAFTNNALVSGFGTIAGSGGFVNNGTLVQSGGTLILSNTGSNLNAGSIDLAKGLQLRLEGVALNNSGSVNLNGGMVTGGAGSILVNAATGTVSGPGTIATSFINGGTLVVDGTTSVTKGFTNDGIVRLDGSAAALSGGDVRNNGRIEGGGKVNNNVANRGTIQGTGGTLALSGSVTNKGNIIADTGGRVLVINGLAVNDGNIQLQGGTFDNNGQAMANGGTISGNGVLRTGGLTQNSQMLLSGGPSSVHGDVVATTGSKTIVSGNSNATFYGGVDVKAGAEMRVSGGSSATFFGMVNERTGSLFTGSGTKMFEGGLSIGGSPGYVHDAGSIVFTATNFYLAEVGGTTACGLACATDQALRDAGFDKVVVGGELSFGGELRLTSWNGFEAKAGQSFDLFDWGSTSGTFSSIDASGFHLAAGTSLDFSKLYTEGVVSVVGGGVPAPVPEPEAYALFLAGLGLLGLVRRRRKHA